jgi:hypothetical protein
MLFYALLIAGLVLLSMALRSLDHWLPVRLGNLCILLTSHLLGWVLTGSHFGGAGCVAIWFVLPWIDLVTRVRRLEMPVSRSIEAQAPPSSSRFPALEELTEEIELLGFEQVEDAGWRHDEHSQFVRVFSHSEEHVRATISLVENEDISFFYVTLCSRGADGRVWFTWNYPFSTTLKNPLNWQLQRLQDVETFLELMEHHRSWLTAKKVTDTIPVSSDALTLTAELEQELRSQVDHNEQCGVLLKSNPGLVRYTWKGCFFLWFQYLREVLRLR